MKWFLDNTLACFDVETTGISVETDRIVTATVANLLPETPVWRQDIQSWLVDPGIDIPEGATAVHGITSVFAKENGEPAAQAVDCIAADLAKLLQARIPMVVCNGVFDFTLLDRECRRHGLPTLEERLGRLIGPVVDVLCLDKWLDPYRKGGRKLVDLCAQYQVSIAGAHDSTFDALAAARVAYRMALMSQWPATQISDMYRARRDPAEVAARFKTLSTLNAGELHRNQISWRAEQCKSLRAYFDRNRTAHDGVPGDWPLIPATTAARGVAS